MDENINKETNELTEHFFRNEYGRLVSVVTKYLGLHNVETAEDIVQETLLKAVKYWQHHGTPPNPQAWLYTTAKNLTFNILKKEKFQRQYNHGHDSFDLDGNGQEDIDISEEIISDEQLKMMLVCCDPKLSEHSQITLILKILCGFSISEIASAFFTSSDTINKRLVRARKELREHNVAFETLTNIDESLHVILKTLYLLFNEGYKPSQKNEIIRTDLCFEAMRLTEILIANKEITNKADLYALSALMYLNASRFEARIMNDGSMIELADQDRNKWSQELINKGIGYLSLINEKTEVSTYHVLAGISANHCVAPDFEQTNWKEILALYDQLMVLENTPLVRLNRTVALSKVKGNKAAISELLELESISEIGQNYLFHATLSEFYKMEHDHKKAIKRLEKAISLTKSKADLTQLEKKLKNLVPIS